MVDLGPLDADALRALIEAAKFGKSLFDDDSESDEHPDRPSSDSDPERPESERSARRPTPSDINNPSIGPGGIIGNVTVNNLYFDTSGRKLEISPATCCHDYPDGRCPHRR